MSFVRKRTRNWVIPKDSIGAGYTTVSGSKNWFSANSSNILNYETCIDQVHPGPPYKSGGPLDIDRSTVDITPTPSGWFFDRPFEPFGPKYYTGNFITSVPSDFAYLKPDITGWGAKGFSRALPVKPSMNLVTFIIELRDVPDMLKSTHEWFSQFEKKKWTNRSASFWGDQYLNLEFGWLPFIQDLKSILNLMSQIERTRQFIKRNNRQRVHRKVQLLSTHTYDTTQVDSAMSTTLAPANIFGLPYDPAGKGSVVTTTEFRRDIWFEGMFRFHIPEDRLWGSNQWVLNLELMGLLPDLNQIWKATPWTWMIDWFTSAGSIMTNVSLMAEYAQVAEYAYVMCHDYIRVSKVGAHRVASGTQSKSTDPIIYATQYATSTRTRETLQRQVASPYGFGLTWDGFNPYQLGILAALGLSRSKFEL